MLASRKWVHLCLILSELLLITAHIILCVMYGKYNPPDWYEKIWMTSKIKTIQKLVDENKNKTYPILEVNDNSNIIYTKNYEYLLEHSSKSNCEGNFKRCGILDSMGNIMCIPNEDQCPINDLIVESRYQNNLLGSNYKVCQPQVLRSDSQSLYSTNKAIDKGIISKLIFSNETQYYINKNNFIFDKDMYQKYKDYLDSLKSSSSSSSSSSSTFRYPYYKVPSSSWPSSSWPSSTPFRLPSINWKFPTFRIPTIRIGGGGGGFRRLAETYGESGLTSYIEQKFKETKNIDTTFRNISDKVRAGYYLGFQDVDSMNKFSNRDLYNTYNLYIERYPNVCSFVFTIILFVAFLILIIFSLTRFCHKDVENEGYDRGSVLCGKLIIIIPYSAFFIGFFIYFVCKYNELYIRKGYKELINIKADPFIEDFLKEIWQQIPKEIYTIIIITLYIISAGIFILAWILSYRFTKRYLNLLEMTTQLTTD